MHQCSSSEWNPAPSSCSGTRVSISWRAKPARRISTAVNRLHAKNISQYINEFRIAEACRLLTETDEPVTRIMFDAGFQTKSNFNREFRRVTGMSPMAWRASKPASRSAKAAAS